MSLNVKKIENKDRKSDRLGLILYPSKERVSIPVRVLRMLASFKTSRVSAIWLHLRYLLQNRYGSFKKSEIAMYSEMLRVKKSTFEKDLKKMQDLNLIRIASDNSDLYQIVCQRNLEKTYWYSEVSIELIEVFNNTKKIASLRSFSIEALIELNSRSRIGYVKYVCKKFGKTSTEYSSLTNWMRECALRSRTMSASLVSSMTGLSETTILRRRKDPVNDAIGVFYRIEDVKYGFPKESDLEDISESFQKEFEKSNSRNHGKYFLTKKGTLGFQPTGIRHSSYRLIFRGRSFRKKKSLAEKKQNVSMRRKQIGDPLIVSNYVPFEFPEGSKTIEQIFSEVHEFTSPEKSLKGAHQKVSYERLDEKTCNRCVPQVIHFTESNKEQFEVTEKTKFCLPVKADDNNNSLDFSTEKPKSDFAISMKNYVNSLFAKFPPKKNL